MNIGPASASHSESIPQSVCAPLTQCSLWTLSAVLFLSSQITAFQTGSWLRQGSRRRSWRPAGLQRAVLGNAFLHRVSAAECKKTKPGKFLGPHERADSDNLEVLTLFLAGISFKCQSIHLEQVTQTFRDLLWRMSSRTVSLCKALGKVQRPLASHSEAGGEEVRHPGLRRLGHAALIKCTSNLRLMRCLLNTQVMFMLSGKNPMTRFPVHLGIIPWVHILRADFRELSPKAAQKTGQLSVLRLEENKKTSTKCHQTRRRYLLPLSVFRPMFTFEKTASTESINCTG